MFHHTRGISTKTRPRRVRQAGQGLVEYAIILSLIGVLVIGVALFLGGAVKGTLSNVGAHVVLGGGVLGAQGAPHKEGDPCTKSNGKSGRWEWNKAEDNKAAYWKCD
jgi:Flp pilus assembly pilin Flp